MKIAIVGIVGLPSNYGGFESLAENIAPFFVSQNHEVTVYCAKSSYTCFEPFYKGVRRIFLPFKANGIQSVIYDIVSIYHANFKSDVILILGVSGAIALPFVRLFSNKKIIVNVDGIEWKRSKWTKLAKLFLKFSEKICIRYASNIIGDNQGIIDYLKKEYNYHNASLIEYGAPSFKNKQPYTVKNRTYLFTVCRIEPENQVHLLLEAFDQSNIEYQYMFVGNWNNSDYGKELKEKYASHNRIQILDPIYDQVKLRELRSKSLLYLHGHTAGGTNPSLIEAMGEGIPICCADVNFNRYTTEDKSLYFKDKIELINTLNSIDTLNLEVIANNMFDIANRRYNNSRINHSYLELIL